MYTTSSAEFQTAGCSVKLQQKTDYPWRGGVRIVLAPDRPVTFALGLRIPSWCRGAKLKLNGRAVKLGPLMRRGYARVVRQWQAGDRIDLDLPMPVERIEANPGVRQDCGRVALRRGPLVYCLEGADNGGNLNDLALMRGSRLRAKFDPDLPGGAVAVSARALRRDPRGWEKRLYRPAGSGRKSVAIKAIPYYLWANRKAGEMLVWIREA